jgi:N-acetylmuramoyl-L-alanine amidase
MSRAGARVAASVALAVALIVLIAPEAVFAARKTPARKASPAKRAVKKDPVEVEYQAAKAACEAIPASRKKRRFRHHWIVCADRLLAIAAKHTDHPRADDAMFVAGRAYRGLYAASYLMDDLNTAIMTHRRMIKRYPRSGLADDAQFLIAEMYEKEKSDPARAVLEYAAVVNSYPKGDRARDARAAAKRLARYAKAPEPEPKPVPQAPLPPLSPSGLVYVREVSHWSSADYTRVVIATDRKVEYGYQVIAEDAQAGRPRRIVVDLKGATRHADLPESVPIADGLLRQARTGQFQKGTCRVVLDIESIRSFQVFSLSEPFRIVIDVSGETRVADDDQAPTEFRRIVIDAGHGGHDSGCAYHGRHEKTIALDLARKVREKLTARLPVEVVLTRDADTFIPLVGRTALANKLRADLFVSIHLNATRRNPDAAGIETYFLAPTRDPESLALAAAENSVSTDALDDLSQYIEVGDLAVRARVEESSILAVTVQRSVLESLRSRYPGIKNRGVRRAPFYVLVGAQMPAILVETGFLSNREEARRLSSDEYQDALAGAIADGIVQYVRDYEDGDDGRPD